MKHADGIPSLKVSSLVSWGLLGNVHFRSFWFQHKCGEAWVNCVYSDTDSQWNMAAVADVRKGEMIFFPSLCAEQRFTISPWLPPLGYITANVKKMRQEKRVKVGKRKKKVGRGNDLDDVIHFTLKKKIHSVGKTYKLCIFFFPKMPNDEQQLQK